MGDLWFYGSLMPTDWPPTVFWDELPEARCICHDSHLAQANRTPRRAKAGAAVPRRKKMPRTSGVSSLRLRA